MRKLVLLLLILASPLVSVQAQSGQDSLAKNLDQKAQKREHVQLQFGLQLIQPLPEKNWQLPGESIYWLGLTAGLRGKNVGLVLGIQVYRPDISKYFPYVKRQQDQAFIELDFYPQIGSGKVTLVPWIMMQAFSRNLVEHTDWEIAYIRQSQLSGYGGTDLRLFLGNYLALQVGAGFGMEVLDSRYFIDNSRFQKPSKSWQSTRWITGGFLRAGLYFQFPLGR